MPIDEDEPKGYQADISQDAVAEALKSVQKRKTKPSGSQNVSGEAASVQELQANPSKESHAEEPPASASQRQGPSKEELTSALHQAREEARAARDRMLRIAADADNQRKRTQKEKEEFVKYGLEGLFRELLPILDNLERTLDHLPKELADPTLLSFQQGIQMVHDQFVQTLAKHQLVSFSALGQPFDPNHHEAISRVETPDAQPGTVLSEIQRGFKLHDRLLRPALVTVACASTKAGAPGDACAQPDPGAAPDQQNPGEGEQ